MRQPTQPRYEFGPFQLEQAERRLLRAGEPVPLTAKVFDLLLILVQNHGHLLEKDELMRAVWGESFVEEGNLTRSISTLRKALDASEGEYIETVPKRGYRFVAAVREWPGAELVVQERLSASLVIEEQDGATERNAAHSQIAVPQTSEFSQRSAPWRRWPAVVAGVMSLALVVGVYWWKANRAQPINLSTAVRSVAVLPFKPLKPGESEEYLGLGLADTLITKLSSLHSLIVRPTSAVLKYAGLTQDPLVAGREQQVDAVLDASLQQDGERIRVNLRLLRVRDGAALWTYQCEPVLCNNIFAMQDLISEEVAAALMPRLTGEERKRLRKHYTENKQAYELYVRGRGYALNLWTADGFKQGIGQLNQALALDPAYALAYAGLAATYYDASGVWLTPNEAMPRAKAAALKALELDEELAEAHTALAQVQARYDWDWPEAEKHYLRALALNPNFAQAHLYYGFYLADTGRLEAGFAEMQQAQRLDPLTPSASVLSSLYYYGARRYEEVISQCQKIIETNPDFVMTHWMLGLVYEQQGKLVEALAQFEEANRIDSAQPFHLGYLGHVYTLMGKKDKARQMIAEMKQRSKLGAYVDPFPVAIIYAGLAEKDEAFAWLEKAYQERSESLLFYKTAPLLDSLSSDPRFPHLLRRMKLAP